MANDPFIRLQSRVKRRKDKKSRQEKMVLDGAGLRSGVFNASQKLK